MLGVGGRVRILTLGVIGVRLARRVSGTTKDGFIGGDPLVWLSWTEWSVHVEAGN